MSYLLEYKWGFLVHISGLHTWGLKVDIGFTTVASHLSRVLYQYQWRNTPPTCLYLLESDAILLNACLTHMLQRITVLRNRHPQFIDTAFKQERSNYLCFKESSDGQPDYKDRSIVYLEQHTKIACSVNATYMYRYLQKTGVYTFKKYVSN